MADVISPRALCSLADVKEYLGGEASRTTTDDNLLIRLCNSASELIYRTAEREFKVNGVNPQTRVFDVSTNFADDFLYVGDLQAFTAISPLNFNQIATQVVALPVVDSFPRIREPWQPITHLRLRGVDLWSDYTVSVTGTWGFPVVPEDIRQAAIVTVAVTYARDVERFSQTFSLSEDRVELPMALPPQVYQTVMKYAYARIG